MEGKREELVEIYKLHVGLTNHVSNRRITTNRFYLVVLSGLTIVFSTLIRYGPLLQHKNGESSKNLLSEVDLEWFIVGLGMLGLSLSWAWYMSIDSYLQLNSRKFHVLKKLENKLEYKFFKCEWKALGEKRNNKTYRQLSGIETSVPVIFFFCFTALFAIGIYKLPRNDYLILLAYPLLLVCWFVIYKVQNREGEQTNDNMD